MARPSRRSAEALPKEGALRFYIPITASLSERRPRTLKQGDTFGLFDHNGDIFGGQGSPEGLYHEDTRYMSELRLMLNGQPPLLLGSAVNDDNSLLSADLTNPDLFRDGVLEQPCNTVHISRSRFIWNCTCYERLWVHNFDRQTRPVEVGLEFACDFADIFEVRGTRRRERGSLSIGTNEVDTVEFSYEGLDRRLRRTTLRFEPRPAELGHNNARFSLELQPGARVSLFLAIHLGDKIDQDAPSRCFFPRLRTARRALRRLKSGAAAIRTSNAVFDEMVRRSMADLYTLVTHTEHGPYPYAGIPWFSTVFGRDGIITAMEMLWIDPGIARGVLGLLAATQSTGQSAEADAQPGKILHEMRQGEMAELGEVPFKRYYGSVDSTPLFVMLAGMYFERTDDVAVIRALWPRIEAALAWIDQYGDRDGDGFVEYRGESKNGLVNQGWKDSVDSVFHADGRLAEGPIALCEVQGYVWAAKTLAASMAEAIGATKRADCLRHEAEKLRQRFEEAFWCEEISTYAIALDGHKKPCRVRSSNAGQVLFSGIAAPERAARVADQMLDPDFFSGWGIRTVARSEPRYNPMSYHDGSIWPHDNAIIAAGLRRYGFTGHVQRLFSGMFDAAAYMDMRRLTELFCGFRRIAGSGPTFYPVACSPQAWSSGAPLALLQACLGIDFDPKARIIWFRKPRLPHFLDEIVLTGLSVPQDGRADVAVHRDGDDVSVRALRRDGDVTVSVSL